MPMSEKLLLTSNPRIIVAVKPNRSLKLLLEAATNPCSPHRRQSLVYRHSATHLVGHSQTSSLHPEKFVITSHRYWHLPTSDQNTDPQFSMRALSIPSVPDR